VTVIAAWMVLVPIAAGMAATTAFLIRWAAEARTPLKASTVVFLLMMMVAMVGGAALYFLSPGTTSLVAGLWLASAVMSVSVVLVFFGFLREVKAKLNDGEDRPPPVLAHPRTFVGTVIALVVTNELLMGWTFQMAAGLPVGAGWSAAGALAWLVSAVDSPWFLFTMSGEMLLTSYLLRERLPRAALVILVVQSVIMFLSPPALPFATWVTGSSYLASAAMIALFVYLMEYLYRHHQLAGGSPATSFGSSRSTA